MLLTAIRTILCNFTSCRLAALPYDTNWTFIHPQMETRLWNMCVVFKELQGTKGASNPGTNDIKALCWSHLAYRTFQALFVDSVMNAFRTPDLLPEYGVWGGNWGSTWVRVSRLAVTTKQQAFAIEVRRSYSQWSDDDVWRALHGHQNSPNVPQVQLKICEAARRHGFK